MAISSVEDFFAVLKKSRLLEDGQLADARGLADDGDDARAVAKKLVRKGFITGWQAGKLLKGAGLFFLGKYKLLQLLGHGGMGSVFLAEHVTMNRRVAIKIISKNVRKDPASLERLLSEARAIATLDHPNIIQAYSVDNEGDRYYIVMEYVDGSDLKQMVEEDGPMDAATAASYIRQAADGLAHAHDHNMIHCDIKPSNLFVSNQGLLKVLDMGLARLTNRGQGEGSDEQQALGSVDYLAPEQALDSPDLDYRADIYSLGCTLYFLLTGHPPFPKGTLPQRIMKHQMSEPTDIREESPDTPDELVEICSRMMAKDPNDRFQSAERLSMALAELEPPTKGKKRALPPKIKPAPVEDDVVEDDSDDDLPQISVDIGEDHAGIANADVSGLPKIDVDGGAAAEKPEPSPKKSPKKSPKPAPKPVVKESPKKKSAAPTKKDASAASAGAGGFAISTEAPTRGTSAAASVAPKKPSKATALMVGGLSIVLLGLVVAVVVSMVVDFGPADDAQASAGQGTESAEEGVEEPSLDEPSLDEPSLEEPSPEESTPGEGSAVDDESGTDGEPATDGETSTDEESTTDGEPATGGLGSGEVSTTDEVPTTDLTAPDGEEPAKDGEPATTEEPITDEEPAAPEEKPAVEEPAVEEPAEQEPRGPLRALVDVIDMSSLEGDAAATVSLGRLFLEPSTIWKMKLVGGDKVLKGKRTLALQDVGVGLDISDWAIRVVTESSTGASEKTDIAQISLADDQSLSLTWGEGEGRKYADALRACMLTVTQDGEAKSINFGAPIKVAPLVVNLDTGLTREQLQAKSLPGPKSLKVEITSVDGVFEKPTFKPGKTVELGSKIVISATGSPVDNFGLQLEMKPAGNNIKVELKAACNVQNNWVPFKSRGLKTMDGQLKAAQANVTRTKTMLPEKMEKRGEVVQQLDNQLNMIKTAMDKLAGLGTIYEKVNGKGTINFRVYTEIEDNKIVLFETSGAAPAEQEE